MNKFFEKTLSITSNRWFPVVFFPIAFLFVLFFSHTTSPLYVFEGQDSCIFKSMGLAILQGKTPYVDFFDHKGPVLYFINAFGQWLIPGRLGIFLLQVLALTVVFFFFNKTARLFLRSDLSFVVVLLLLFILAGLYQEGNQCEEWELLAISISFYFAASFFICQDVKSLWWRSIIWGICMGYVFFIRPNDAVSQLGGILLGLCAFLLVRKEHLKLIQSLLIFGVSFFLVAAPIILFFAIRHAVPDLYYGLIQHNALYSEGLFELVLSCIEPTKLCFFLLFILTGCHIYKCGYHSLYFLLIPLVGLSLLLTGPRAYLHYYIVYLPLFILFFAFLFKQKDITAVIVSITLLLCCSGGSIRYLRRPIGQTKALLNILKTGDEWTKSFYEEAGKLVQCIPMDERDEVWNYNLMWNRTADFSILYHYGIVQCNLVPLFSMYLIDSTLKEKDSIEVFKPKWVFISHEEDTAIEYYGFAPDYEYISNHYSLVSVMNPSYCSIELYRRK